jgi:U3 small nucleolar RNA-associated protein 14
MPGRQSHGGPPAKKPRVKNNSKKRALDAFSIASHTNPDKIKIRQHRLGVQEGGNRPGKRRRDEDADENDGEEEVSSKKIKKGPAKGRFDELDIDAGSDSEGNEWKLGQVDSDDDSDLDSDEAFGESDEERFNGYAFSGSSKKQEKDFPRTKDVNLDEDEDEESDSELEDGDLGEDAM